MKTTFYLIRHGQSLGNLRDQFIGHTDIELTDLGRQQAEMAAGYLKDIPADAIYSSDLQRAYETAMATAKRKNMPVISRKNLREINAGLWEEKTFTQLRAEFSEDFTVWCEDFGNARCTGGESVLELQARFVAELRSIAEENPGKTFMIFAHATPIRMFRAHCENAAPETMGTIPWATNASVTHAEYEKGTFRLISYSTDHFMGKLKTALPKDV